MKAGRKNLKMASEEDIISIPEGQSIMQVVSLRGSNVIEVMDDKGIKSLALFPAKFQKSIWIKKGSFVVVDESVRDKALESGCKIACIVSRVLHHEQVRTLEKSQEWSPIFRSTVGSNIPQLKTLKVEEELDSDDEDGLPPLVSNSNRDGPAEVCSDSETDTDTGSDPSS